MHPGDLWIGDGPWNGLEVHRHSTWRFFDIGMGVSETPATPIFDTNQGRTEGAGEWPDEEAHGNAHDGSDKH